MANKYEIVTATSATELNDKINACISEGWQPQGSHKVVEVSTAPIYGGTKTVSTHEYSQTMVKK